MKIGIFGGFFNPPHVGHVHAARSASLALSLDKVLLIPSCQPPHKEMPEGTPPPETRLRMVSLIAPSIPNAEACDIEIARGGISYTCDTVAALRDTYPDDELWLIVGTDMLLCLQNWRRSDLIFQSCRIAALARMYGDSGNIYQHADVLMKKYGAKIDIIPHDPIEISSSILRNRIRLGDGDYIPRKVFAYITKNHLYGYSEA